MSVVDQHVSRPTDSTVSSRPEANSHHEPRIAPTARRSSLGRVARMTRFEFTMIFRQRVAILSIMLAPLIGIGMPLLDRPTVPTAWIFMLASMSVLVLILAVYNTTTSTVVARRENQILKRLRTSELLPGQMLVSMALPYVVVGTVQVAVVAVAYQLLGGPTLLTPGLFAVALSTAVVGVLGGFATAGFAANSERVQFAALPVLLVGLVASIFVLNPAAPGGMRTLALLAPFASSSDLTARVLGAPPEMFTIPDLALDLAARLDVSINVIMTSLDVALILVWAGLFAAIARRTWRWEPRG